MGEDAHPDPLIAEITNGKAPGRAIDLGCGLGANTLALAADGWEATGVDGSQVAIERNRQAAAERGVDARFETVDLTNGIPGGPYDLITMFFLHLQVDDHARLLASVTDSLNPGGTFLYAGHDKDFVHSHDGTMGDLEHRHDDGDGEGHDWAHSWEDRETGSPAQIAAMLTGLHVERAELLTRDIHHGPQLMEMTDVIVVATKD